MISDLLYSFQLPVYSFSIKTILWALVLILSSASIYWYGFGKFQVLANLSIPGPKPLPFIASLLDEVKSNFQLHICIDNYIKKYGKCFGFYFRGSPAIVVSDTDMVQQIMVKDFSHFHDRMFFAELPEPLRSMIVYLRGQRWRLVRQAVSPGFSKAKLKKILSAMNEITENLLQKCRLASTKGETTDMCQLLRAFTLDIFLSSVYGQNSHTLDDPNNMLSVIAQKAAKRPKFLAFLALCPGINKLLKYIPFGVSTYQGPLTEYAKNIIQQRRGDSLQEKPKDMLQILLDAQTKTGKETINLTDNEVYGQCLQLLIAGYEPVSNTLIMSCYVLAKHPDIQEKVYNEIIATIPESCQFLDYDVLESLTYFGMVISETMRLYPPVFRSTRQCTEDCVINGIPFKKGFRIWIPIYSIHRDTMHWQDPEKFIPERFLKEEKLKRDPYAYIPFGAGPRICLGRQFSYMELKAVLARLLREFRLEVCEDTPDCPMLKQESALTVIGPVKLRIVSRL